MKVEPERITESVAELKAKGFDYLVKITAVDYKDHLEVLYFLRDMENNKDEIVTVELAKGEAVHSIERVFKGADWYERELSEMFGIGIEGRDAKRLLLEKWDGKGAPLLKEFVWGAEYESE